MRMPIQVFGRSFEPIDEQKAKSLIKAVYDPGFWSCERTTVVYEVSEKNNLIEAFVWGGPTYSKVKKSKTDCVIGSTKSNFTGYVEHTGVSFPLTRLLNK